MELTFPLCEFQYEQEEQSLHTFVLKQGKENSLLFHFLQQSIETKNCRLQGNLCVYFASTLSLPFCSNSSNILSLCCSQIAKNTVGFDRILVAWNDQDEDQHVEPKKYYRFLKARPTNQLFAKFLFNLMDSDLNQSLTVEHVFSWFDMNMDAKEIEKLENIFSALFRYDVSCFLKSNVK